MSGAIRAGVAVFVVGLLLIWLIRPIGNACPDVDKLPSGSKASSAPSFAPPLTRTCTYTTPEGTKARKRHVPVLDVLALLFVAGVAGGLTGLAGRGRRERVARPPAPSRADDEDEQRERDAAERERERQERAARRRR